MAIRLYCACCFAVGILSGRLQLTTTMELVTILLVLSIWLKELRKPLVLTLALAAGLTGWFRADWDRAIHQPELPYGVQTLEGHVLEPPRRWGSSTVFFFEGTGENVGPIKILVQWSACEQNLQVGDRWSLSGRFIEGEPATFPGGFDQREWLWSQGAVGILKLHDRSDFHFISPPQGLTPHQLSYRARAWMLERLQGIRDPQARSLVAGVVFGETQSLPKELQEMFRRTGTSHLLAASGMNVALLAGLVIGFGKLLGFGPWRVAPWAIPVVIGYAFLAGCAPSITRAATGTSLALLALSWGRTNSAWNSLAWSTWILLMWDPRQIYDLGFQLSVLAVVGLVGGPTASSKIGGSFVLTISASLLTLPVFWWSFGELSTTLLISNLILGPLIELLFPLGLVVAVCPRTPLVFFTSLIAQWSLTLVSWLSGLASPILLTRPGVVELSLVLLAVTCWVAGRSWSVRCLALWWVGLAVAFNLWSGGRSLCPAGHLVVRKIGAHTPFYWISTPDREILVVNQTWQKNRAKTTLRQLGCLVEPEIRELNGRPLRFQWGKVTWQTLERLLPRSPYLVVTMSQSAYRLETWESQSRTLQD